MMGYVVVSEDWNDCGGYEITVYYESDDELKEAIFNGEVTKSDDIYKTVSYNYDKIEEWFKEKKLKDEEDYQEWLKIPLEERLKVSCVYSGVGIRLVKDGEVVDEVGN